MGNSLMSAASERDSLSTQWMETFQALYHKAITSYENGVREAEGLCSPEDIDFLTSIGATPQEVFDCVEDWCDDGAPDPGTVFRLTEIRRDYFIHEQHGDQPGPPLTMDTFPSREASMGGLVWFPRILAKARAKLRGELPANLMYSCGADRRFLRKVNMDAVEFLRLVRDAKTDDTHIVRVVVDRASLQKS
ncbi:MAG: DUF5069 domain-containing protein [Nitrospirales bacterium]|nr:DUF5069 domain-containing protein [Nitrospirales bacterium]